MIRKFTGNEDLSQDFVPDAKLGFVVNAIYTMAHALHSMRRDVCSPNETFLCDQMKPVNGTLFLQYLLNASFRSYSNDSIYFNDKGDPPGRYDIMNFRPVDAGNGTKDYKYVRVGGWDNGELAMKEDIFWPGMDRDYVYKDGTIASVCSKPCFFGEIKVR